MIEKFIEEAEKKVKKNQVAVVEEQKPQKSEGSKVVSIINDEKELNFLIS